MLLLDFSCSAFKRLDFGFESVVLLDQSCLELFVLFRIFENTISSSHQVLLQLGPFGVAGGNHLLVCLDIQFAVIEDAEFFVQADECVHEMLNFLVFLLDNKRQVGFALYGVV